MDGGAFGLVADRCRRIAVAALVHALFVLAVERIRERGVRKRPEAEPLEAGAEAQEPRRLAGRVMARRDMGKTMFLDLVDRSADVLAKREYVD